jgi:hypothetical protein
MRRLPLRCLAIASLAGPALLAVSPAKAQMSNSDLGTRAASGPVVHPAPIVTRPAEIPPALPGAVHHGSNAPERGPLAADADPTEALFDAINHGDMNTAKDALARGADLNGRNILGMTPIDLSIDLGRNEITFLLLSMRGASSPGAAPAPEKAGKAPVKVASTPAPRPMLKATAKAPAYVPPRPERSQQFVSNNPGTPIPQAGFLGFGGPQQ